MYTIAIMLQKGGGGKSTLCTNLAVAAGKDGKTPLIVDLDPQATACKWSDRRKAAHPELDWPVVVDAQPARLAAALSRAEQGGVDFAFIDTPARSEQAALEAAKVADLIIYPCRPGLFDLETFPSTREIVKLAGDKMAFAVLNSVQAFGSRHEQARRGLEKLGIYVCPQTIGNRAAFGDAGALGLGILELEPNGKGGEEILQLYSYICRKLEMSQTEEAFHARA